MCMSLSGAVSSQLLGRQDVSKEATQHSSSRGHDFQSLGVHKYGAAYCAVSSTIAAISVGGRGERRAIIPYL